MMVKAAVSTSYYWINHVNWGKAEDLLLCPRKKFAKHQLTSLVLEVNRGKSTEIDQPRKRRDFEIDRMLKQGDKAPCLLTVTDRKAGYQIIRMIPSKRAQVVRSYRLFMVSFQKWGGLEVYYKQLFLFNFIRLLAKPSYLFSFWKSLNQICLKIKCCFTAFLISNLW